MNKNFGDPDKNDIDPKVRRLFPWALFLILSLLFAACGFWVNEKNDYACYGHERLQAIFDDKPPCVHPTFEDRAREFFNAPGGVTPLAH